jgi:hypothetical protein
VLYNAQMIRTWSLLLRTSHRRGYIVAGRFDATALVESPYLMHPIEHKTAGEMEHIAATPHRMWLPPGVQFYRSKLLLAPRATTSAKAGALAGFLHRMLRLCSCLYTTLQLSLLCMCQLPNNMLTWRLAQCAIVPKLTWM